MTRSRNRNDDAGVTVGAGGRGDVVGHGGVDLFVVVVDGGECRLTVVPFPPRSTSRCLVHGVELAPPTSYAALRKPTASLVSESPCQWLSGAAWSLRGSPAKY